MNNSCLSSRSYPAVLPGTQETEGQREEQLIGEQTYYNENILQKQEKQTACMEIQPRDKLEKWSINS